MGGEPSFLLLWVFSVLPRGVLFFLFFEQQTSKTLKEREVTVSENLATTTDQRPIGCCRLYHPQNKPEVAELPMATIVSVIIADSLEEDCPCWETYIDCQLLKRSETLTRLSSTVTVQVLALQC